MQKPTIGPYGYVQKINEALQSNPDAPRDAIVWMVESESGYDFDKKYAAFVSQAAREVDSKYRLVV